MRSRKRILLVILTIGSIAAGCCTAPKAIIFVEQGDGYVMITSDGEGNVKATAEHVEKLPEEPPPGKLDDPSDWGVLAY